MSPSELKTEIDRVCVRDWANELAPLEERLRRADSTEVFHALFPFAVQSERPVPLSSRTEHDQSEVTVGVGASKVAAPSD
jgi:hypothetical protein